MARPCLLNLSNFQLLQPTMKNKNLILLLSTLSSLIQLYGNFSSLISRPCVYGVELRRRKKAITATIFNLFCCQWTKISGNTLITSKWVNILYLQATDKETVVETIWDTFLKGYCAGVAALIRKSQQQPGIDDQFLSMLAQASNGGRHAHVRLRYAHQVRSDDFAETGLVDLCARFYNPPTYC